MTDLESHLYSIDIGLHLYTIGIGLHLYSIGIGLHLYSISIGLHLYSIGIGLHLHSIGIGLHLYSIGIGLHLYSIGIGLQLYSNGIGLQLYSNGIGLHVKNILLLTKFENRAVHQWSLRRQGARCYTFYNSVTNSMSIIFSRGTRIASIDNLFAIVYNGLTYHNILKVDRTRTGSSDSQLVLFVTHSQTWSVSIYYEARYASISL